MTRHESEASSRLGHEGRCVLVGVCGGIAAYKTPELVRRLRERGAEVRVVMTRGAQAFITPLTLQAVSGHRVHETLLDADAESGMGHIELARWADEIVIAPATADVLARLACGLADDLLTTVVLASRARLWLAPAMNNVMWEHPSVQHNLATLSRRGARMLGPESGSQACGETGPGRMSEPEAIAEAIVTTGVATSVEPIASETDGNRPMPGINRTSALSGRRFVVTAGPTHEAIDPVRFIGNRSSGRMGFAVAEALVRAGAEVMLIAGPVHLDTPAGVKRIDVNSALEMRDAVFEALPADGFVSVAAVADYRPAGVPEHKIKKSAAPRSLELVANPDIVSAVAASDPRPYVVGFAAETERVESRARAKLADKGLDLIAANLVGDTRGFDTDDNTLDLYSIDRHWPLGHASKHALATALVDVIADQLEARQ